MIGAMLLCAALVEPSPEPPVRVSGPLINMMTNKRILRIKCAGKIKEFRIPEGARISINGHKNCTLREVGHIDMATRPSCKITMTTYAEKKVVTLVVTTERPWDPVFWRKKLDR